MTTAKEKCTKCNNGLVSREQLRLPDGTLDPFDTIFKNFPYRICDECSGATFIVKDIPKDIKETTDKSG